MKRLPLIFALVITITFSTSISLAQQVSGTTPVPAKAQSAAQKKALEVLESLAGQLGTLQSAENRARIAANIAESIWTHDEQKARSLFAMVEEDLKARLQVPESVDPRDKHTFQVFQKLRADTIERIAKHDPEYALAFLRATKLMSEDPHGELDVQESKLEMSLARRIVKKKPELAAALARKTLETKGLSADVMSILKELYQKDKDLGSSLFKDIFVKLKEQNPFLDWSAIIIVQMIVASQLPSMIDESSFREFIAWVTARALESGCGKKGDDVNYSCRQLGPLMDHIKRFDPSRASQLTHWEGTDFGSSGFTSEMPEFTSADQGSDDILQLAKRYPYAAVPMIRRAMTRAAINGDLEEAGKLANGYDGDPSSKQFLMAQLESMRNWSSINEETIAELQKTLSILKQPGQQIQLLSSVANRLGGRDRATALRLLNQASSIADGMKPGREQAQAQLSLAKLYCLEKSSRCFEIVQNLIPMFNDLVDAGVKLDGFDNRYVREGEWTMTAEGGVGSVLTQLAQDAAYYAWSDFDRALDLSNRFARSEIRMMSQLKLAQGILAGPPQRPLYELPFSLGPTMRVTITK